LSARASRKPRESAEAPPGSGRRSLVTVDLGTVSELLPESSWPRLEAELARLGPKLEDLRRNLPALDISFQVRDAEVAQWRELADELRANSDVILLLGAGGCLLAARFMVEAFQPALPNDRTRLVFVGDHLHPDRYAELIASLQEQNLKVSLVMLCQNHPPLELVHGYRILANWIEGRHGLPEARRRIVLISNDEAEAVVSLAQRGEHRRLVLPDRTGSQFLAMTAAGLFPMACAGLDIGQFVEGARSQARSLDRQAVADDPCYQYALARQVWLGDHQMGEQLVVEEPGLHSFGHWWRYVMAASSAALGVPAPFPAFVGMLRDNYTLGSLYQNQPRLGLIEINVRTNQFRSEPPQAEGDRPLAEVYREARQALSDSRGQLVPQVTLTIDRQDLFSLGALVGFFETVAAINQRLHGLAAWNDGNAALYESDSTAAG